MHTGPDDADGSATEPAARPTGHAGRPTPDRAPTDPRRARSFGAVADAYATHRPHYPADAVAHGLHGRARTGSSALRVLDLGAGTGALTASLSGLGLDVVAVEPDPDMLARLRSDLPAVDTREGSAEAIPLPGSSVDAVLVGQALHWFDMGRAGPEMARVLRPGGVLAALWNAGDHAVAWLHVVETVAAGGRPGTSNPRGAGLGVEMPGDPLFGPAEHFEVRWTLPRTIETYLADLATHSWALTLDRADRDAALTRVRDYLAARPETASGGFDVPMVTLVRRTLRR